MGVRGSNYRLLSRIRWAGAKPAIPRRTEPYRITPLPIVADFFVILESLSEHPKLLEKQRFQPERVPPMTTATQPREMSLPELRKFEGQLFISNNTKMLITVHEKIGDKQVDFELDPAGEPDSIAFLTKLALDVKGLQKLWMKGAVSISTDPDMENTIMLMNAQSVGASEQRMQEILGYQTENDNHRDLEEKTCLVCGRRNSEGAIERGRVLQSRHQVKKGEPPLCPEHVSETHKFVPRLTSNKGEDTWEFDSIAMTQAER